MKLHVDLETLQLIEGPGFRNPITSLRFKRGDAALLEASFLESGTTPVSIGDPASLEIRFGIKPRNRYDIGYLVHTADWTMPAVNAENPVYQCSPNFNTVELDSALGVGSAAGTELSEITLMGEITWREGNGQPTSTRTFLVIVENDVNRGTEGVPTSAEPPYPSPGNLVTLTDLLPYAKTDDLGPIERNSAPVNEDGAKVSISFNTASQDVTVNVTVEWNGNSSTVSCPLGMGDVPPADFVPEALKTALNDDPTFSADLIAECLPTYQGDLIVTWRTSKPSNFSLSTDQGSASLPCSALGVPATIAAKLGESIIHTTTRVEWLAVSIEPSRWKPRTITAGTGLTFTGDLLSISSAVALKAGPQTFTGTQTFSGSLVVTGMSTFYHKMLISYGNATVPALEVTQSQSHHTAFKVTGVIRGTVTTNPASIIAPAAGEYCIYAETVGGKTRLMVKFPTGNAQQIAIEP